MSLLSPYPRRHCTAMCVSGNPPDGVLITTDNITDPGSLVPLRTVYFLQQILQSKFLAIVPSH